MSIPAILEDGPPAASAAQGLPFDVLPHGRATVHMVGGKRIAGDVQLTANWVIVTLDYPDPGGAVQRVFSPLTVISIDFGWSDGGDGAP